MNRMVVRSRIDTDGVLRVNVPVGRGDADREVQLTIEPATPASASVESYADWIERVAGQWQGEFERMPQGEFEQRDSF